jgi:hypothetical protein
VNAISNAVKSGHQFVLPTGQVATLSAGSACGATSLTITSLIPSAAVPSGTPLRQQVTISIAKMPTGFTVIRTDDGASASYADSTWSGGYMFIRNGRDSDAAVSCSSLTIS